MKELLEQLLDMYAEIEGAMYSPYAPDDELLEKFGKLMSDVKKELGVEQ